MKIILDHIRPARPLRRNIQCIAFMASAALVGVMVAQGIRIRLNVLDTWHYVAPIEDIGKDRLWELLQDGQFKYIGLVTFLVSPTGSNQTFTASVNWNSSNNKIETIGGGGSGGACQRGGGVGATASGGGGGAYSAQTNLVFVPGVSTATYQIGSGSGSVAANSVGIDGGDSWFNGATLAASSVGAKGGHGGSGNFSNGTASGVAGGAASSGVGATKFSGGSSGTANGGANVLSNTGGGGAAGPNGAGNNSSDASVGTGTNGGSGDAGSGGAGGATGTNGSPGGNGTEFDSSHGSGGGGGAANSQPNNISNSGGNGGLYGGGGGASGDTATGGGVTTFSGTGAQGIIVVTNVPATRAFMSSMIIGG